MSTRWRRHRRAIVTLLFIAVAILYLLGIMTRRALRRASPAAGEERGEGQEKVVE